MPRYTGFDFDSGKLPELGTYFCTQCNTPQRIVVPGQKLVPCPNCGCRNLATA